MDRKKATFVLNCTNPDVTASMIGEFENKIGFRLPNSFKLFIQNCNGGVPEPEVSFNRAGEEIEILNFIPFLGFNNEGYHLWSAYNQFISDYDEDLLLPFATDILGNRICISLLEKEDAFGVIVSVAPSYGSFSVVMLAKSLDEFLNGLFLSNL